MHDRMLAAMMRHSACRAVAALAFVAVACGQNRRTAAPRDSGATHAPVNAESGRSGARLVVLIVIDQLGYDILRQVRGELGAMGLSRLAREGAEYVDHWNDTTINITAPGHTHLVTGGWAREHGIVANKWLDRARSEWVESHSDNAHPSAVNLRGPTVGDLARARDRRSIVVSVTGKRHVAVLLAGHTGEAFFFDERTGLMRTPGGDTPSWLARFNATREWRPELQRGRCWERLPGPHHYAREDDAPFEQPPGGMPRTLPWCFPRSGESDTLVAALEHSPWQMEQTLAAAEAAAGAYRMGADDAPDLLLIGISTVDLLGHRVDPYSNEVHELLLRTDRALGELVERLRARVPHGLAVLVTADHGAPPSPAWIRARSNGREAAGVIAEPDIRRTVSRAIGDEWDVLAYRAQVYLVHRGGAASNEDTDRAERRACAALVALEGIEQCFTRTDMLAGRFPPGELGGWLAHDFDPERSGNLHLVTRRYFIVTDRGEPMISSHGFPHDYDRHIVLFAWGDGVVRGQRSARTSSASIAPTLARLLGLPRAPFEHAPPLDAFRQF